MDIIARALAMMAASASKAQEERLKKLDDKLIIGNYEDLPSEGVEGTLYVAADRHIIYTWSAAGGRYIPYNSSEGGTEYYDSLKNLPTLNGVTIVGDKTDADYGICKWNKIEN